MVLGLYLVVSASDLTRQGKTMGYENRLFDASKVHTIDIVMDDWDSFIEGCESELYSSCTVVIDGEKYGEVAIRAKGNTSLSSVKALNSTRYSLKLEFDHYENGKSYHGLDKLCLNNIIQDNTMMKDYLVYQMMADFGVDTPLCSFTYITVNGEDYGLYLAVEGIEDSFLERNYGATSGELYKPDSLSFGGGGEDKGGDFDFSNMDFGNMDFENMDFSNMDFEDFDFSNMDFGDMDMSQFGGPGGKADNQETGDNKENKGDFGGFGGFGMGSSDVKLQYIDDDPDSYSNIFNNAKTDVTKADKTRLIETLKKLSNYEDLDNIIDTEEVLRYFVVHTFVCNDDSYTGSMIHNYYLHEEDGSLAMIPWDYNLGFGSFNSSNVSGSINSSISNPISGDMSDRPMVGWIFSDEQYTLAYYELYGEFMAEWINSGRAAELIDTTADMIKPYVEKDPTKFCTTEEFEAGVSVMKQFIELRAQSVNNQLAGDDTTVDTTGLDLSLMGSMNTGGGFGGGMPEGFDMGSMPEGFGGGPGNDSNQSNVDGVSKATVDAPSDKAGQSNSTQSKIPGGMPGGMSFTGNANSEAAQWRLVGISVLVLAVGLVIAIKKKY